MLRKTRDTIDTARSELIRAIAFLRKPDITPEEYSRAIFYLESALSRIQSCEKDVIGEKVDAT